MSDQSSTPDQEVEILLVEDNPGDVRLLKERLANTPITNTIHVTTDGQEALDFLHQSDKFENAPYPDLILLDFNLPRINGDEVLAELQDSPELSQIPVIMMAGSEAEKDRVQSEAPGANTYIPKPLSSDDIIAFAKSFEHFGVSIIRLPDADEDDTS